MPVGFKNGTDGNVQVAADAINSASRAHHFISIDRHGAACAVALYGNPQGHVVPRGGKQWSRYSTELERRMSLRGTS